MKRILFLLSAVLLNCLMGTAVAVALDLNPMVCAVGANVTAAALPTLAPNSFHAGVLTEVWTGELIKKLRAGMQATFLDGVEDHSTLVNHDVIHMVEVGIDPDVLVNNSTYPIELQSLPDGDKTISLDKFQTKPTPVTDDELYALSYDKMARVKESHGNAINDKKFIKAAHALCAAKHTEKTPVLKTTGARDETTGRLKLTLKDVIEMKRQMDLLRVPAQGRRLVLCPDHVNDLLESEQMFREQYNINRADGAVGRLYGFDIYDFAANPTYSTAGAKNAVDATPKTGEFQCSFAFYTPRIFKATGSTKMYYSDAATDPQNQRSLVSFRHYFICLPKKEDAGVVMMSGYQAS